MYTFSQFILENASSGGGLTVFDIDDTLFHTTAQIRIVKDGKVIKKLNSAELNHYVIKPGEEVDYSEFRSAEKFNKEATPIVRMINKAKAILKNTLNKVKSKVIIVTARNDFDDKDLFLDTFRKHGIDIDRVRVERAGKITDIDSISIKKLIIIRNYLNTKQFARARLFDDSKKNLEDFLSLKDEFHDITFEAWLVKPDGSISKVN